MIKIPYINETITAKYLKDHFISYKATLENMKGHVKYQKVIDYLSTGPTLDDKKIKKLLIGDFDELKSAVSAIGEVDEREGEGFHRLYYNFTQRKRGKEWADLIGVRVCPYCNRSYIFTLKKSGVRPQYDHYFPKSAYPYLAVSMYNLIPCCAVCNTAKSSFNTYDKITGKEIFMYPYKDEYGYEVSFQTSYEGDFRCWLGASDKFSLAVKPVTAASEDLKRKLNNTSKELHLSELYEKHKDYVKDIISRTYIYNDDYIQSLLAGYPEIFQSTGEVKNFVYMNYLEKENWGNRILAKLTFDIMREFTD